MIKPELIMILKFLYANQKIEQRKGKSMRTGSRGQASPRTRWALPRQNNSKFHWRLSRFSARAPAKTQSHIQIISESKSTETGPPLRLLQAPSMDHDPALEIYFPPNSHGSNSKYQDLASAIETAPTAMAASPRDNRLHGKFNHPPPMYKCCATKTTCSQYQRTKNNIQPKQRAPKGQEAKTNESLKLPLKQWARWRRVSDGEPCWVHLNRKLPRYVEQV